MLFREYCCIEDRKILRRFMEFALSVRTDPPAGQKFFLPDRCEQPL